MLRLALFLAAGSLMAGDLAGVKTVYLLPMSSGFDQYLAIRLVRDGAMQVVTDPKKADAVFTDRIGANFEKSMQQLYAPPVKTDGKLGEDDQFSRPAMQPLSRGRGSLFLVDRESHVVLWSTFARSKTTTAVDLNDLAAKVVQDLDKTRKGK